MKVGDKLLCKKDKIFIDVIIFINDNYYTITIIDKTDNSILIGDIWFYLFKKYNPNGKYNYWFIWDYFYTPQELRKLKLKKLKQCLR